MSNSVYFLMLLLLISVVASGCQSMTASGSGDQLPWNTPAAWESTIIGVPY